MSRAVNIGKRSFQAKTGATMTLLTLISDIIPQNKRKGLETYWSLDALKPPVFEENERLREIVSD